MKRVWMTGKLCRSSKKGKVDRPGAGHATQVTCAHFASSLSSTITAVQYSIYFLAAGLCISLPLSNLTYLKIPPSSKTILPLCVRFRR